MLAGGARSTEDLLRVWAESTGVEGAALYLESGQGGLRRASHGAIAFPESLAASGDDFGRVDLASSTLLFSPRKSVDRLAAVELLLGQSAEIQTLRNTVKEQSFQDSYRLVELEALYEVGLAIASTLDLKQLAEGILYRAVSLCDARQGALYLLHDGSLELEGTIGGDAAPELSVDSPELVALLAATDAVEQKVLLGAQYPIAVSIEIEGKMRGLLAVADKESRQGVGAFLEADRRTLGLFANQAAIALENAHLHQQALEKERLEREMELAAEIQQRLLPKTTPSLSGFEVVGWNRPALQVSGDYYGFVALGGGRTGLVVADVTGKGMPAALLVSTLHSALRLLLDGTELSQGNFCQLNEHIVDSSSPNKFITLIMVEVEPESGSLRFLNAGHNPGLLVRGDGSVTQLKAGGMPLGLLPGSSYTTDAVDMGNGDLLCLYSDGITECESPTEGEFGLERLQELLLAAAEQPLDEVLERIESTMVEFAAGQPQGDDQSVVLLRRSP